jgi:hypothetical protein
MYSAEQAKLRESQRKIGKFYAELKEFNAKQEIKPVDEDA